ncbi:MAG: ArnT family glycosyltransferase [Candidatus Binatia bacterium]
MFRRAIDEPRFHVPILLSLCLLLYFPFLSARDLWEHENHYAEVTRIMLVEGSYALPMLNQGVWADNPPFFFWLTLLVSRLAGEVNEWTMRILPAVAGTALILVFYLFFRQKFGPRMVFIASMTLATALLTVHVVRHIPINAIFFLFIVASMFYFMEVLVFDSTRWRHVYGAWLFLALACLTKGPFTALFPATVIALYLAASHNWKKGLALRPLTGGLLFLTVSMPWFAYAIRQTSGAWAEAFLAHQHFWHLNGNLGHDLKAVYYSAVSFPIYFFPWSFVFFPALIGLWPERAKIRDGAILFLVMWALSIFFFYPFYGEEHSHYLFLTFLPAALAVGVFLERIIVSAPSDRVRDWTNGFLIFCCCFVIVAAITGTVVAAVQWRELVWKTAAVGLGLSAAAVLLLYASRIRNYAAATFIFAALLIVPNLLIQGSVLPAANWLEVRPFAEKIGAAVKPGAEVGIYERKAFLDFNFYSGIKRFELLLKPKDAAKFLSRPGARYLLARKRSLPKLQENWKGKLQVVLTQDAGGSEWWFPPSGRWVLLHSCSGGCESPPSFAKSDHPLSAPAQAALHRRHRPAGRP